MNLTIDVREHKDRRQNCIHFFNGKLDTKVQRLEYGDYLFSNGFKDVVFEYKTIEDFINSIKDTSVFEEVINQTYKYDFSYLVIVGDIEEYCERMWKIYNVRKTWKNYNNYIKHSMRMFTGAYNRILCICPVINVSTENSAFIAMEDISDKIMNNNNFVFGSKRRLKDNNSLISLLSVVLGKKTSELVVNELELTCLKDLLDVKKEDLLSIKGIGDKKANDIMEFIIK